MLCVSDAAHAWCRCVYQSKGASTLCRAAKCNTLQLCRTAKVARHMPLMRSCPHEKRIVCRPFSGYQNCGMRSANLVWFFFLKLADTILKPLIHHMPRGFFCWDWQFADRIFRPRSIERHAAAKPMQRPHILWHGATFAVRPCRFVLRGIVWMYL